MIVGLIFGALGGILVAAVQAEMSHRMVADQFVVGLTLNILDGRARGVPQTARSRRSPRRHRTWNIPLLNGHPTRRRCAVRANRGRSCLLYALVPITWWLVFRTRWGLEVRASGEDPQAADVSGIDVNRRRRQTIYYTGLTSGLGGAFLIFVQIGRFEEGIVSGRGFIAIAAVIFGGWTLRGTVAGCVLFAGALSFRLSLQVLGYDQVNSELLQALPFLITILAMAVFATRVRPPAALARPFFRGLK